MERLLGQHDIAVEFCQSISQIDEHLQAGCGVLVMPAAALGANDPGPLLNFLRNQPTWSDLPIIFIAHDEHIGLTDLDQFGNTTILRQPLHIVTLMSAIRTGLASRRKQYQLRDLLLQHENIEELLRQKDKSKDEFLATLAHEMRNPLSPLKNALELMELQEDDPEQTSQLREIMSRQVHQLKRIVEDLMDVSRIRENKVAVVRTPVNLVDSLQAGIEASRPFINESRQELLVDLESDPIMVNGDSARLAQITVNLLNNAAKYTPNGGKIWLSVTHDESHARIVVRDNGCGVAPDKMRIIFSMFEQLAPDKERGSAGLGIGLALVKNLVELHNGKISVFSEGVGKGSTFTIELPLCDDSVDPAGTRAEPTEDTLDPLRVLVIDDAPANRIVLERLLVAIGQEVRSASDGIEGLKAAGEFQPHVIFSDVSMPLMDGYELARCVREDPKLCGTTLIAVTGNSQPKDRQRALENGFDAHLTKPVDFRALKQLLAQFSKSAL